MADNIQPQTYNSIAFGVLAGLVTPVIFFMLYFLFRIHSTDFAGFLKFLTESKKFVHVISLSVFPNLIPFMLFMNSSRYKAGRGVLGATILLGIVIFVLKFAN
jgi:hypothetical protein